MIISTPASASSMEDFEQVMQDIYKFSPLIGLENQPLLQTWVRRLAVCRSSAEQPAALEYARYLAYQLQNSQLRFPFSQAPPPHSQSLLDLKQVLFGSESVSQPEAIVTPSREERSARTLVRPKPAALFSESHERSHLLPSRQQTLAVSYAHADNSTWDSHHLRGLEDSEEEWTSHIADPIQNRAILSQIEDLPENAPLWHILARVAPHTRDGGALLQAVVAEELAEWSARLAADLTIADKLPEDQDEDEGWGPRANRRVDYWVEVCRALDELRGDVQAGQHLGREVDHWLQQQRRQLQVEQAQQTALIEELRELQQQTAHNQRCREMQHDLQNRALKTEIASLKDRISENSDRMKMLQRRSKDTSRQEDVHLKRKSFSLSHDSLNTPKM